MELSKANILGACIAFYILSVCILIFIFRLSGQTKIEYWLGVFFMLSLFPLIYLLITSIAHQRPAIYYVQIVIMLIFILAELLLDYLLKIDFRNIKWMTITYAMLFFASTGGMIGIASNAGKSSMIIAVILFFLMSFLAIFQRIKTGM